MAIFYRPADAVAADFIPFYHDGIHHLFYLKDWRNTEKHGDGTPWFHLTTSDNITFEELGEAIPRGPIGAQDRWIFTGCVFAKDGIFHIFYTAHNHHRPKVGLNNETIAHATSPDLLKWTKDPDFEIKPLPGFNDTDWRDPFVFWNEEAREYQMLLAARKADMPARHSGCTARLGSADLLTWTERRHLYAPDTYFTHECPDLFRIGDWWYLIFSEFSQTTQTRYRMARSIEGPWLSPDDDSFDGRGWYAAKTSGDGHRRFAYGWLATRNQERDAGEWQWGGNLVVHELHQRSDGTLASTLMQESYASFSSFSVPTVQARFGAWQLSKGAATYTRRDGCGMSICEAMRDQSLIEATVRWDREVQACGLLLRVSPDATSYYQVRIEPKRNRLVIDRWPRPGDQMFMLERPLACTSQTRLRCIVDGSCLVVYIDDQSVLSCRIYDHQTGDWGLFVDGGSAEFTDLAQRTRP
jgi:beta-fructofuranosidase